MQRKILNGGFIGLLILLIGVAIIIFFIMRTDWFTGQKGSKNMIEQNLDSVNRAKEVKIMIEQNSRQSVVE
jgi:hypothetical protein